MINWLVLEILNFCQITNRILWKQRSGIYFIHDLGWLNPMHVHICTSVCTLFYLHGLLMLLTESDRRRALAIQTRSPRPREAQGLACSLKQWKRARLALKPSPSVSSHCTFGTAPSPFLPTHALLSLQNSELSSASMTLLWPAAPSSCHAAPEDPGLIEVSEGSSIPCGQDATSDPFALGLLECCFSGRPLLLLQKKKSLESRDCPQSFLSGPLLLRGILEKACAHTCLSKNRWAAGLDTWTDSSMCPNPHDSTVLEGVNFSPWEATHTADSHLKRSSRGGPSWRGVL